MAPHSSEWGAFVLLSHILKSKKMFYLHIDSTPGFPPHPNFSFGMVFVYIIIEGHLIFYSRALQIKIIFVPLHSKLKTKTIMMNNEQICKEIERRMEIQKSLHLWHTYGELANLLYTIKSN